VAWTIFIFWLSGLRWRRPEDRRCLVACACFLAGAAISSYRNSDIIRMFEVVAPLVFVACAISLERLWSSSKPIYGVLLACMAIEGGLGSYIFGWHWRRFPVANVVAILVAAAALTAHANGLFQSRGLSLVSEDSGGPSAVA